MRQKWTPKFFVNKDVRKTLRRIGMPTGLFCIVFLALLGIRFFADPTISEFSYQFEGQKTAHGANPLFVERKGDYMTLTLSIDLPLGRPHSFYVKPDDCLEEVTINNQPVKGDEMHYCDYTAMGRSLDFSNYLKRGNNFMTVRIKDLGGLAGLRLTPDYADPFFVALHGALIATIVLYCLSLIILAVRSTQGRLLASFFIGGSMLRVLYFLQTPYDFRGHDVGSHIDYIRYVATSWKIPPASEGWEYHQAPLYYYLSALWWRFGQAIGWSESTISRLIQGQSLLLSILTLAAGCWMATLLFKRKEPGKRLLFAGLIAVFPTLIFHTVSINNNSLSILLSFLLIAFLLRWWQSGKPWDWYGVMLLFALSFITRVSALLFLPVIGLLLAFKRNMRWGGKWRLGILSLLFLLFACGWLPFIRFFLEHDPMNSYTFGKQSMSTALAVPTTITAFTTFNPIKILETVYNNPWDNDLRRQFFWEYYFKSAFFGEFGFPDTLELLSISLLFMGLLLLPFGLFGIVKTVFRSFYARLPLLLSLAALLGAQFFYRFYAPFSANQDFRFSVPLLSILFFFALEGVVGSWKYLRYAGEIVVIGLTMTCTAFLVLLLM